MSLDPVANFATSLLPAGIGLSDTSLTLATGDGNLKFPLPSTAGAFNVVIWNSFLYSDPIQDPGVEILRVTARAGVVSTNSRGQDGTAAAAHNTVGSAYKVSLTLTALMINNINLALSTDIQAFNVDGGALNGYVINPSPAVPSLQAGMTFLMKAANSNTGVCTLNVSGLGVKNITSPGLLPLAVGDIVAGTVYQLTYDGTQFQLLGAISYVRAALGGALIGYAADTGSANAYAMAPAGVASYFTGLAIAFKAANTNTGASTLNVNGLGTRNLMVEVNGTLTALPAGAVQAGNIVKADYDGTEFILTSRPTMPFSQVSVDTPSGHGSTNTKIRHYTNTVTNSGAAITYASSATLGDTFTINEAGIYAISLCDSATASNFCFGISRNATLLTTNIQSQAAGTIILNLGGGYNSGSTSYSSVSWQGALAVGDVIRSHDDGSGTSTSGTGRFTITKLNA